VHIVQRGENLFRIAMRYNATVESIAAANNIRNPRLIYVGQRLNIPQGEGTTPGSGRTHMVRPGENLFRIALRYGTTAQAIAAANNLPNIHLIYAGQVLHIP
jgi:LysM repeat protein